MTHPPVLGCIVMTRHYLTVFPPAARETFVNPALTVENVEHSGAEIFV